MLSDKRLKGYIKGGNRRIEAVEAIELPIFAPLKKLLPDSNKAKANYRQCLSILPIIRLSLGVTAKLKLYNDYPHSDGFFLDSFGGVTSESLLAEREGFKPPKRTSRFPDFESGPFGHSGISPKEKTPVLNYRVQR